MGTDWKSLLALLFFLMTVVHREELPDLTLKELLQQS